MSALKAVVKARGSSGGSTGKPLRFVYFSGWGAERDQTKTPTLMAQYALMRVCIPIFFHSQRRHAPPALRERASRSKRLDRITHKP